MEINYRELEGHEIITCKLNVSFDDPRAMSLIRKKRERQADIETIRQTCNQTEQSADRKIGRESPI